MISSQLEFLYNIYFYVIKNTFKTNVCVLRYTPDFAVYTLELPQCPSKIDLNEKVLDLIQNIKETKQIHSFEDPLSLFFNIEPELRDGIFYYNPFRHLLKQLNKPLLREVILNSKVTKKSKSIKVQLPLNLDLVAQR